MRSNLLFSIGILIMIFLVGGVLAGNQTCMRENSACCEGSICATSTIFCAAGMIPYLDTCDSNCSPIMKCKNLTCITEPGKVYYPGTEKCCDNLTTILPKGYYDNDCNKLDVVGAPLCAPCGNGKCEREYGEDKCNCAEDCNADCTKDENNKSCCDNGTCVKLFDDRLPSACSDGNLPEFSGCDADCKPVAECSKNECNISKDCWDKFESCYYTCQDNICGQIRTLVALHDYPNCSGDEYNVIGPQDVLCAPDKKQCADGSYVGRAGFDCEFMPCLSGEKAGFFEKIFNWFKNIFS